jgi:hypothetical protein
MHPPERQPEGGTIFVYGVEEDKEIKSLHPDAEVIDISRREAIVKAEDNTYNTNRRFYATQTAWVFARKKFPSIIINSVEKYRGSRPIIQEGRDETIAAIETSDGVLVSKTFHSKGNASETQCWMTVEQAEMIISLLGDGYEVRLLNEDNQLIRTMKGKRK